MTRMHRRAGRFERLLGVVAMVLAPGIAKAQLPDPVVSFPNGSAFHVAAGGTTTVVFDVHNVAETPRTTPVGGRFRGAPGSFDEYTFEPSPDSRCSSPTFVAGEPDRIRFDVGPLAAGESVRCSYRMNRGIESINDLAFDACSGTRWRLFCAEAFYIGSLPDMQLIAGPAEPVAPGATSALVRLTARNPLGPEALARSITTECTEFEFGQTGPFPFDFENDFPGACPTSDHREMCLNFTGQAFDSRGFLIGPTTAGGEASCLVRLRFREPLSSPVDLAMYFTDDIVERTDGGRAFDPGQANGVVRVGAAPGGTGSPEPARLPLSPTAAVLLAALLGGVAAVRLRRRAYT